LNNTFLVPFSFSFAMRKIIPSQKPLIQLQQPVLGCAVPMRAYIFIVTLSILIKILPFGTVQGGFGADNIPM
jgi:hypothetical protein